MEGQVPYVSGASYGTLRASVSLTVMWGNGIKLLLNRSGLPCHSKSVTEPACWHFTEKTSCSGSGGFWNTQKSAAVGFLGAF